MAANRCRTARLAGIACDPVELSVEDVAVMQEARCSRETGERITGRDRSHAESHVPRGRRRHLLAKIRRLDGVALVDHAGTAGHGGVYIQWQCLSAYLAGVVDSGYWTGLHCRNRARRRAVPLSRWSVHTAVDTVSGVSQRGGSAGHVPGTGARARLVLVPYLAFAAGSAVYAWVFRYRQVSTAVERQQTMWVAFGLLGAIGVVCTWLVMALSFPPDLPGTNRMYALLLSRLILVAFGMIFPLSVTFAILRYRLYDIDILINRTVVYGMLSTSIVGLYMLVVGTLSVVFQSSGHTVIAILSSGLAAILVQPLRTRLQRGVNRLMYGERDDPYTVLSHLSQQLRSTLAPDAVLPAIVDGVARRLKLPYVAVALRNGERLDIEAAHGQPTGDVVTLPLLYRG